MHTFFHGWRRKVGCVTLLMALVFMGGWVRSRSIFDSFSTPVAADTMCAIESIDGHIAWHMAQELPVGMMSKMPQWKFSRFDIPNSNGFEKFEDIFDDPSITAMWRNYDFAMIEFHKNENVVVMYVPYWSITIPLTLLSAYLLLVPSRKRPPTASQPDA